MKNGKVFSGKYLYLIKYLDLIKVSLVFSASSYGQAVVIKKLEKEQILKSPKEVLLLFEVLMFYGNIAS